MIKKLKFQRGFWCDKSLTWFLILDIRIALCINWKYCCGVSILPTSVNFLLNLFLIFPRQVFWKAPNVTFLFFSNKNHFTYFHRIADTLNMGRCVRWLRSKNCCYTSFHQVANSLWSMKAVLRHNSLYFSVQLGAWQNLVVRIDLINCITECYFLRVRCLVVIVVRKRWEQAAWYRVNERSND